MKFQLVAEFEADGDAEAIIAALHDKTVKIITWVKVTDLEPIVKNYKGKIITVAAYEGNDSPIATHIVDESSGNTELSEVGVDGTGEATS